MATRAQAAHGAVIGRIGIFTFSTPLLAAVIAGGLGAALGGVLGGLHAPWAAGPPGPPAPKPCPIYCGPDDNELVPPECAPPPTCGNKICEIGENVSSCSQDCSLVCGDGVCNVFENATTCQADCTMCGDGVCGVAENTWGCLPDCPALSYDKTPCGNGYCEPWHGENPTSCSKDCLKSLCGDGVCTEWDLDCAADCAPTCGDHVCGAGESSANCVYDCCDTCGNGFCSLFEKAETCPADCSVCGNGVCSFDESPATCPKDCHPIYYVAKWTPPFFLPLATIPGAGIVVITGFMGGAGVALLGRKKRPPHRQTIRWLVGLALPLGAIGLVLLAVNASGAPLFPPPSGDIEPIDVTLDVTVPPGCHCEGSGLVCPDFRLCKATPTPSGSSTSGGAPSAVPVESDFTAMTGPDCTCEGTTLKCAGAPVCGGGPRLTPTPTAAVGGEPATAVPTESVPETSPPVETQQTEPYCKDGTLYLPGQPPAECNPECMNCRCENGQRVCDFCGNDGVSCGPEQTEEPGPVCGNGVVEVGESCDPPGGACSNRCQLRATPKPAQPYCGDGVVNQRTEQCDPPDGNNCDSQCHFIVK